MKKYPIGFNTRINKEPEESVWKNWNLACHHLKLLKAKLH